MEQIKRAYEEAANLHSQAKAILAEYQDKEMPKDKGEQVDKLLDQVDAKTEEAKRLEKAETQRAFLEDPATRKEFYREPQGQTGDATDVAEYKDAFSAFLRKGPDRMTVAQQDVIAKGPPEYKDLSVGVPAAGGFLVANTFYNELITLAKNVSAMRRISRVLPPVPAGSSISPAEDTALTDATWTTEILTGAADVIAPFGQRTLTPHPLAKRVLVSNDLLRNPNFDVEVFVRDRMAYHFAEPEEAAFVAGTGVGQPLGILNTVGLAGTTTAAALTVTGTDIINWRYGLGAAYESRARILCNRSFIRRCRSLLDGVGNYIWQPGLASGTPNAILDVPYELSDQMPTALNAVTDAWVTTLVPAVIGDFSYYWIVDQLGMSIQRLVELYAQTNQVGFIGRKACDGLAVRAAAFRTLIIQ